MITLRLVCQQRHLPILVRFAPPREPLTACVARAPSRQATTKRPTVPAHRERQARRMPLSQLPLCPSVVPQYSRLRTPSRAPAARQATSARAEKQQLSVCVNKTCKKQGSQQIAKFAEDLGLKDLAVERTGCLAKCGNGPNMVLSPLNVTLSHINSAAKMTEVLRSVGGYEVPEALLKATELRLAGNGEARSGRLQAAADLYSRALELEPPCGRHLLLSNRSGVLLSLGQAEAAARDADEAASIAPRGFRNAVVRQVEARSALKDHSAAAAALKQACQSDPSFANTAEYTALKAQLARAAQQ